MESIISTFHIDWKIIIAQSVNFAIVFSLLYYFAIRPVNKLMAERNKKISQGIDDAKTNAELLTNTKAEYEAALVKARAEAQAIFQKGKKEAEAKKTEMTETAKKEVETMIAGGKKTLEAEKVKMVEEAKKEIASLAVEATRKILAGTVKDLENVK
ncbi:MAG: F0F1 ATP synthase subunit B [Patescibacteria group bacterium]